MSQGTQINRSSDRNDSEELLSSSNIADSVTSLYESVSANFHTDENIPPYCMWTTTRIIPPIREQFKNVSNIQESGFVPPKYNNPFLINKRKKDKINDLDDCENLRSVIKDEDTSKDDSEDAKVIGREIKKQQQRSRKHTVRKCDEQVLHENKPGGDKPLQLIDYNNLNNLDSKIDIHDFGAMVFKQICEPKETLKWVVNKPSEAIDLYGPKSSSLAEKDYWTRKSPDIELSISSRQDNFSVLPILRNESHHPMEISDLEMDLDSELNASNHYVSSMSPTKNTITIATTNDESVSSSKVTQNKDQMLSNQITSRNIAYLSHIPCSSRIPLRKSSTIIKTVVQDQKVSPRKSLTMIETMAKNKKISPYKSVATRQSITQHRETLTSEIVGSARKSVLNGKEKCVKDRRTLRKPAIIPNEKHRRSVFDIHTESSLTKRRIVCETGFLKQNGFLKHTKIRNNQARNIVLQQKTDNKTSSFPQDKLTTSCQSEQTTKKSNNFPWNDLRRNVSCDFKQHTKSDMFCKNNSTRYIDHCSENHTKAQQTTIKGNPYNNHGNKKELVDSPYNIEVLYGKSKPTDSKVKSKDITLEEYHYPENSLCEQSKRGDIIDKTWTKKKDKAHNENVRVDCTCSACVPETRNANFMNHIANVRDQLIKSILKECACLRYDEVIRTLQKNFDFAYQCARLWQPNIFKNPTVGSTTSLKRPMCTSSPSARSYTTSNDKSEQPSIKHANSNESTSGYISQNESSIETTNKSSRTDAMPKIYKHLIKAKQQQKLPKGEFLVKGKRSMTEITSLKTNDSKITNKRNTTKLAELETTSGSRSRSRSRSRYQQMSPIRQAEIAKNQNGNNPCLDEATPTCKKNLRRSEMIHALKEIIKSTIDYDSAERNATDVPKSGTLQHEITRHIKSQMPDYDISSKTLRDNKFHLQNNKIWNKINTLSNRSSRTPASTQVDSDSFLKLDPKLNFRSEEASKSTPVIEKQTSPCKNGKIACNTTPCVTVYGDVEVPYDLVNSTNLTAIDTIEVKSENAYETSSLVKCIDVDTKDKCSDELPMIELKERLFDTGTNLESEEYNITETMVTPVSVISTRCDFTQVAHKNEACENIYLKPTDYGEYIETYSDKDQDSIVTFNKSHCNMDNSVPSNQSLKDVDRTTLSICSSNTSYCDSSEELTKQFENKVRYENVIDPELKPKNIPNEIIAALQLTAERVQNIQKAIVIYNENLISRRSEEQDKDTIEDSQTSNVFKNQYDPVRKSAYLTSGESDDSTNSEDENSHFIYNKENSNQFPASSSDGLNQSYKPIFQSCKTCSVNNLKITEGGRTTVSQNESLSIVKSILNQHLDLVLTNVNLLVEMLAHHMHMENKKKAFEDNKRKVTKERSVDTDNQNFKATKEPNEKSIYSKSMKTGRGFIFLALSIFWLLSLIYCITCIVAVR